MKMFKVELVLEEGKWDERYVMKIIHNGEVIDEYYDGGEPEDNSFVRDWNWVPGVIEEAYRLGFEDCEKGL